MKALALAPRARGGTRAPAPSATLARGRHAKARREGQLRIKVQCDRVPPVHGRLVLDDVAREANLEHAEELAIEGVVLERDELLHGAREGQGGVCEGDRDVETRRDEL